MVWVGESTTKKRQLSQSQARGAVEMQLSSTVGGIGDLKTDWIDTDVLIQCRDVSSRAV
jgi:hypothetical protein